MTTYPATAHRVWNTRPWASSPLMRASDRVESVLRMVAVLVIIAALPAAIVLGEANYRDTVAHNHPIPGTHSVDAIVQIDVTGRNVALGDTQVPVRWTVDGRTHDGLATGTDSVKKGDHLQVEVTPDGNQAPVVESRAHAIGDAFALGAAALALVTALVLATRSGLVALLDRRRCRTWGQEWDALADVRRWNRL